MMKCLRCVKNFIDSLDESFQLSPIHKPKFSTLKIHEIAFATFNIKLKIPLAEHDWKEKFDCDVTNDSVNLVSVMNYVARNDYESEQSVKCKLI